MKLGGFLLVGLGVLVGASLATGSLPLFGALFGGIAIYVWVTANRSRAAAEALRAELAALRKQLAGLQGVRPAPPAWTTGSRTETTTAAEPDIVAPSPKPAVTPAAVPPSRPVAAARDQEPDADFDPAAAAEPGADRDREGLPPDLGDTLAGSALGRAIRDYFTGGNTVVRVGVIVLFFGVAFLIRYVAERTRIPIELRLAGIALGALGMLVLGWRLRARRPGFGLALQGGAVGILYLTVFAALRLYALLPPAAAFVLLVLIVAFSAALAILQDSLALAVLGVSGGFLAPILASTGEGSHVVLFSYYALLNLGIVAIAWFKSWRLLNLAGFLFTFVIGTAWGVLRYRPEYLASTEPFLVLFFLLYVAIAVLFAFRRAPQLTDYADGTLIFGTPIVAFALQAALLQDQRYGLAFSAVAVGALYLGLARALFAMRPVELRLLVESFLALAVAFLTVAVPLALDGRWSAVTWALEGAALVWIGCRTSRWLARTTGVLLQFASGFILATEFRIADDALPFLNGRWLGGLVVAAGAVVASTCLERYRDRIHPLETTAGQLLFWWGLSWWAGVGLVEIDRLVSRPDLVPALLLFTAGTGLLSSGLYRGVRLGVAGVPPLLLLPVLALLALLASELQAHPFAGFGLPAWLLAFGASYLLLRRHEPAATGPQMTALHVGGLWLLTGILTWECVHGARQLVPRGIAWREAAWVFVPALVLLVLPVAAGRDHWPFREHQRRYLTAGAAGLALWSLGWILFSTTSRVDTAPLPYLPLLNPVDVMTMFVALALATLWQKLRAEELPVPDAPPVLLGLVALSFLWANAVLLRTLHQWAGVPFDVDAMLGNTLVQTSFSIFWTVLALGTMVIATRRGARPAWLVGAGLLAVVVVKLFLVDLSRVGTVERIVSFLVVGALMLLIGYLSPVPPATVGRRGTEGRVA